MPQLLLAYWLATGIGFIYIVGSAAMGHFHGGGHDDIDDASDPGDVDGGDADGGDPGDVDGGDADGGDPGDVDSGEAKFPAHAHSDKAVLVKDASTHAATKHNRSLQIYLKVVGFFSPTKLALFFFFFGAIGIVTLHFFPAIGHISLIPAVILGYAIGRMLLNLLGSLMPRMHSSTNFKEESLVGSVGQLSLSIQPGLLGEIMISTRGSRHSAAARATDPTITIKSSSKVIISDFKDGVFYVEPFSGDAD